VKGSGKREPPTTGESSGHRYRDGGRPYSEQESVKKAKEEGKAGLSDHYRRGMDRVGDRRGDRDRYRGRCDRDTERGRGDRDGGDRDRNRDDDRDGDRRHKDHHSKRDRSRSRSRQRNRRDDSRNRR
jgi:hypothetical protein